MRGGFSWYCPVQVMTAPTAHQQRKLASGPCNPQCWCPHGDPDTVLQGDSLTWCIPQPLLWLERHPDQLLWPCCSSGAHAGITCHFCRQKKLCGEDGCPRCSQRCVSAECIGKSDCSRCHSATGRFCRACLLIRYGETLEVRHAGKGNRLGPVANLQEQTFRVWAMAQRWQCHSCLLHTNGGVAHSLCTVTILCATGRA